MSSLSPEPARFIVRQLLRLLCVVFIVGLVYLFATGEFRGEYQSIPFSALFLFVLFGIVVPSLFFPSIAPVSLVQRKRMTVVSIVLKTYLIYLFIIVFIFLSAFMVYSVLYDEDIPPRWKGTLWIASILSILCIGWVAWAVLKGMLKVPVLTISRDSISIDAYKSRSIDRDSIGSIRLKNTLKSPSISILPPGGSTEPLIDPAVFSFYLTVGPRFLAENMAKILDVPLEIVD